VILGVSAVFLGASVIPGVSAMRVGHKVGIRECAAKSFTSLQISPAARAEYFVPTAPVIRQSILQCTQPKRTVYLGLDLLIP